MSDFLVPATVSATVDHNGRTVLLNETTGRWHALNATGTRIFDTLRRGDSVDEAIVALVADHPTVPVAQLVKDTQEVVSALVRRGLIVPDTMPQRRSAAIDMALAEHPTGPIRMADRLIVLVAVPAALLLLALPFRLAVTMVDMVKRRWTTAPADHARTIATLVATHVITKHYPGRFACLERSLTCVLALALRRRAVDWCFGASTDPRSLHSWVEIDGVAVVHPLDEPVSPYRLVFKV